MSESVDYSVPYGVVKTLESLDFVGKTYICSMSMMVERIVHKNGAAWVVFESTTPGGRSFQYTPGGRWEELVRIDGILVVA